MKTHEQALIDQCLSGEWESFAALIEPYQDRLFNTLYRLLGRREDAAEMLQEAMIRAFKGLKSYQGSSSFYTWLYRIAVNVAFTNKRKKSIKTISSDAVLESNGLDLACEAEDNQPSHRIEQVERQQAVESALATLAEPFRSVLVLKDIEGLKYEEISEILDIPVGTVRSRLHRARGELRDRLAPLLEQGRL